MNSVSGPPSGHPVTPSLPARRIPSQARSIRRVRQILDAASALVMERGVDAVTTRAIATSAQMPVASLYQYFADRDAVLLALVERDIEEMDAQVAADLGELTSFDIATVVRTTMLAFVKVYHRRPAFVEIYLRGRTNRSIMEFCREHNRRIARELHSFGVETGLLAQDTDEAFVRLAVGVGDSVFQLAFEHDLRGESRLIEEGIHLVSGYLARYSG